MRIADMRESSWDAARSVLREDGRERQGSDPTLTFDLSHRHVRLDLNCDCQMRLLWNNACHGPNRCLLTGPRRERGEP